MASKDRIYERFRQRKLRRRVAAIIYLVSAAIYLGWRLTIFNEYAMVLSTAYFIADVIAVLLAALTIFVSWHYRQRDVVEAPPDMSVDVFIPVYHEPVEMIRRTLIAAIGIEYPHQTWLLDDGRRSELRELANELGCRYVTRANNKGAKAGNLNHALSLSKADYVAVFDADHIPQYDSLHRLLGFFTDPKVGMVQAPQDYYNTDAIQYMSAKKSGALWHDQSFFYNLSQPGRDYWNAASCAGTSVVYRRSALAEIGGIPEETVTEDVHTSLKMHKAGYSVPYLNEPVAYGVAASDLRDYYRTRLRYGHGNIHALRHEKILSCRGLNWRQRISYLFLGLIYLEGWQQFLVFIVPCVALFLGMAPFDITIFNVLVVLLFPIWSYLMIQEVGCGYSRYWTAEIFSMMRFPVHLMSALALFTNNMKWRGSRKNIRGRVEIILLLPQIIVVVVSLAAVAAGIYRLEGVYKPGPLLHAVQLYTPNPVVMAEKVSTTFAKIWPSIDGPESAPTKTQEIVVASEQVHRKSGAALEATELPEITNTPSSKTSAGASADASSEDGTLKSETLPVPPATKIPTEQKAYPEKPALPIEEARDKVEWFQPLITGYSIDLVLIAGFWALINAVRAMLVVMKVYSSAKRSRKAYFFNTLLPIVLEKPNGRVYARVVQFTSSEIVLEPSIAPGFEDRISTAPVDASLYLPDGVMRLRLTIIGTGRKSKRFSIEAISETDRKRLENFQYETTWHRLCRHHDADFITPIGWVSDLLMLRFGQRAKGSASIYLYRNSNDPEGSFERLAIGLGKGKRKKIYSTENAYPAVDSFEALEFTKRGAIPTQITIHDTVTNLDPGLRNATVDPLQAESEIRKLGRPQLALLVDNSKNISSQPKKLTAAS